MLYHAILYSMLYSCLLQAARGASSTFEIIGLAPALHEYLQGATGATLAMATLSTTDYD